MNIAVCTTRKLANVKKTKRMRCGQYQEMRRSSGRKAFGFRAAETAGVEPPAKTMGSPARGTEGSMGSRAYRAAAEVMSAPCASLGDRGVSESGRGSTGGGPDSSGVLSNCVIGCQRAFGRFDFGADAFGQLDAKAAASSGMRISWWPVKA